MSECTEKIKIIDTLDKEEISQLHAAVSGFSSQSFELKKLCVTIVISACTIAATVFRDNYGYEFLLTLKIIILTIPILFYIVDITTYYYQDKLRCIMFNLENNIRRRNEIELKNNNRFSTKQSTWCRRVLRAVFSTSNIIYWSLVVVGVVIFIFI